MAARLDLPCSLQTSLSPSPPPFFPGCPPGAARDRLPGGGNRLGTHIERARQRPERGAMLLPVAESATPADHQGGVDSTGTYPVQGSLCPVLCCVVLFCVVVVGLCVTRLVWPVVVHSNFFLSGAKQHCCLLVVLLCPWVSAWFLMPMFFSEQEAQSTIA